MRLLVLHEVVDADDDLLLALDRLLEAVGRLRDLPLREAALDRRDHAAHARRSRRKYASASASMSCVSFSTKYEPPSGSTTFATPLSWAMICCVRSASVAASSVGSASASSSELVCSDFVPPSTPASACSAVRTTLL